MIAFSIATTVLLVIVLILLVRPFLCQPPSFLPMQSNNVIQILREQKFELDAAHEKGELSAQEYAQNLEELERRTLEEATTPTKTPLAQNRHTRLWAVAMVIFLPLAAGSLYLTLGEPRGLDPTQTTARPAENEPQITREKFTQMVEQLAQKVKAEPQNTEAKQMLARGYMVLGNFEEASQTYAQLVTQTPDDANMYADWASAMLGLHADAEPLLKKSLALDPQNFKALALSGTIAFEKGDFKKAIADWEKARASAPPDKDTTMILENSLKEARDQLQASAEGASTVDTTPSKSPVTLKVSGDITLADELKNKTSPEDILYVFARSTAGGPPVASLRYKAGDLPIRFDFSASTSMLGQAIPDTLIIGARISKNGGNPMPLAGDLQGFSSEVSAQSTGVNVSINSIVK